LGGPNGADVSRRGRSATVTAMAVFPKLTLLVVGGDRWARTGLAALLREHGGWATREAGLDDALPALAEGPVDAIVWDCGADGQARPERLQPFGDVPFVALVDDSTSGRSALARGASAIVPRDAEPPRLVAAVHAAAMGLVVVDGALEETLAPLRGEAPTPTPTVALTAREREVLDLMVQGLSNPEIASELSFSTHTAKFHVQAILDKLGAQTRTEAVVLAARAGLVQI
jgi:two-component system nitrate/nitrite response regulator NarL